MNDNFARSGSQADRSGIAPCKLLVSPCSVPAVTVVPPAVGISAGENEGAAADFGRRSAATHHIGIGAVALKFD